MKSYYEIQESEQGKRIDIFNENWYYLDNEFVPSVTFILSADVTPGLMNFYKEHGIYSNDIVEFAKNTGTEFHQAVENLIKNNSISFSEVGRLEVWQRVIKFYDFYQKNLLDHKITHIEQVVRGSDYAGTVDLITEKDGKLYIFDWKSSKMVYEHHKLQVSAYAKAINADYASVVCFPENPTTKQGYSVSVLDRAKIEEYYEEFRDVKKKFDKNHRQPAFKSIPYKLKLQNISK